MPKTRSDFLIIHVQTIYKKRFVPMHWNSYIAKNNSRIFRSSIKPFVLNNLKLYSIVNELH